MTSNWRRKGTVKTSSFSSLLKYVDQDHVSLKLLQVKALPTAAYENSCDRSFKKRQCSQWSTRWGQRNSCLGHSSLWGTSKCKRKSCRSKTIQIECLLCEVRANAAETANNLKNKNWHSQIRAEAEETVDDPNNRARSNVNLSSWVKWSRLLVTRKFIATITERKRYLYRASFILTVSSLNTSHYRENRNSPRTTSDAINPHGVLVPLVLPLWPPCWSCRLSVSTIWRQSDLQRRFFRWNVV